MQNKMPAKITQNFSTSLEKWLGGYLGRMKVIFGGFRSLRCVGRT